MRGGTSDTPGISWGDVRDVSKHLTVHRMVPTAGSRLVWHVDNSDVES